MAATMTSSAAFAGVSAQQPAKLGCDVRGLRALPAAVRSPVQRQAVRMAAAAAGEVPDMNKRNVMNLLLVGAASLPIGLMGGPYLYFFFPKRTGGGGGSIAKDALGNDVKASEWLKTHSANTRQLTQGLKGDATYLIVNGAGEIEKYGLNAVCTHLGCVVPWNNVENKFKCPCHGSQYNAEGKVIRGPAPLSLALAHCDVADDLVTFTPWTETDFRTNLAPWWS